MNEESVKVRDLIRETEWRPGKDYDQDFSPVLSVLLPTFRRAADGLLRRVADSILGQTMKSLELIIVDDASTDGSSKIIADLMREDGRVSCLRHPKNIGLPAVSEYEAYRRARGRYIGFGFDDFLFEEDAYERLVAFAEVHPNSMVHGHITWQDDVGNSHSLGNVPFGYDHLAVDNFIGNASVVLPRTIIENVGLYDPHISLSRVCDWDLWRRIQRRYMIRYVPVAVGTEMGASRADSLGNTYPMITEAIQEIAGSYRDDLLVPQTFEERDIWTSPVRYSYTLGLHLHLSRNHFQSKFWAKKQSVRATPDIESGRDNQNAVIGVYGVVNASTMLCFGPLRDTMGPNLNFIYPHASPLPTYSTLQLLRCDAVIFMRHLFHPSYKAAIEFCRDNKIPCYYATDDNFIELASEVFELEEYSISSVKSALKDFSGVLAASDNLCEYFLENRIHQNVIGIGAAIDVNMLSKLRLYRPVGDHEGLKIAYFGGGFRDVSFLNSVLPALVAMSEDSPVGLYLRQQAVQGIGVDFGNIDVQPLAATDYYDKFLAEWNAKGVDVTVHPPGNTINSKYKTANALLTSCYLGSIPVVANEPAYASFGANDGVVKVDGSSDSWREALEMLRSPSIRADLLLKLERCCLKHFDVLRNAETLNSIMAAIPRGDAVSREIRHRHNYIQAHHRKLVLEADVQWEVGATGQQKAAGSHVDGLSEVVVRSTGVDADKEIVPLSRRHPKIRLKWRVWESVVRTSYSQFAGLRRRMYDGRQSVSLPLKPPEDEISGVVLHSDEEICDVTGVLVAPSRPDVHLRNVRAMLRGGLGERSAVELRWPAVVGCKNASLVLKLFYRPAMPRHSRVPFLSRKLPQPKIEILKS